MNIKRISKFIIVGLINTLNYYICYLMLLHLLHMPYIYSHLIAFLLSFLGSYFLNCYFVFHVQPSFKSFIQFPLTQIVNMGTQTLLLYFTVDLLHVNQSVAPLIALIFTIPITYLISTYIFTKESK